MNYFKAILLYFLLQISILQVYSLNPEKIYKYAANDFGVTVSDSTYLKTADGYNIFTCFFNPEVNDMKKTIIISYGDAGNLSFYFLYAKQLTNYGYTIVLFDYRGFGRSDDFEINKDQLFYTEFAHDLSAVIDYTRMKYPQNSTGIMAFSMGTIITTLVSDAEPIDFIIAENYVTNLYAVKERLDKIAKKPFLLPANITDDEYISKIEKIRIPLLVFSSTLDQVTTLADSFILAANEQCKIVPYEGNHGCGLLTLSTDYFEEITQFLNSK